MDNMLLALIIFTLANWRISFALTSPEQDGPFGLLHWIRHFVGVRYNELGDMYATNEVAGAFTCLWCLSVWVGAVQCALYLMSPDLVLILMAPFALSAGAIIVDGK